jgi:small subunit ribosomal protein S4e
MARGLKKHLKRLNAPKHWMLNKLGGTWAPRPSTGPHKLRECLPLSLILRNRLKLSLNRRETNIICMKRKVQVDGKVRTDMNYPAGLMDVVSLPDTKENYRLVFDVKGRFQLTAVSDKEAQFKLCRITKVSRANKATSGRNPFFTGQKAVVPYAVTHDGRTLRFIDPTVAVNDTVKIEIATGKVVEIAKFSSGKIALISGGKNVGRVGEIVHRDRHPGGFDIVHLKDVRGNEFATRVANVFVIGEKKGDNWVLFMKLAKGNGVKRSIQEQYEFRIKKQQQQRQ